MFKRNEGILDRIVRFVFGMVALPAGLIGLGGLQGSGLGLIIAGLGLLALITGLTGFCILYVPFGFSTLEKEQALIAKCTSRCTSIMSAYSPGHTDAENLNPRQGCGPCHPVGGNANEHHQ